MLESMAMSLRCKLVFLHGTYAAPSRSHIELNAVSQAESLVLATLGSCPTIRALLLPKRFTHALHNMGNGR